MLDMFGAEGSLIIRFVVAFVIVLGLIALTFWLIRRFGGARVGTAATRGRAPRLAVVDAAPVDGRRRLVLVRRDNVEHLLMIGGPADVVIEQNIVRAVPVTQPRDVPIPRTPGAVEAASAQRAPVEEWTPPAQEPQPSRPQPDLPRDLGRDPPPRPAYQRPELVQRPPRPTLDPLSRPTLPPSLTARPEPPPIPNPMDALDDPEPRPAPPPNADAALASMAQRLEAALRRPGSPPPAPPVEPAERAVTDFPTTESPATAPNGNGVKAEEKTSDRTPKSKSVLDSLEEEMASLLGRPAGKE
jgi:flagellar biogenesis protein FliO